MAEVKYKLRPEADLVKEGWFWENDWFKSSTLGRMYPRDILIDCWQNELEFEPYGRQVYRHQEGSLTYTLSSNSLLEPTQDLSKGVWSVGHPTKYSDDMYGIVTDKCVCTMMVLLDYGCRCGKAKLEIAAERARNER